MSASAGVAVAAHEGLAADVRGESAGAQAAIVIVCREPGARQILHRELSKRYGADYQIVVCDRPEQLAPWMRTWRRLACRLRWSSAGSVRRTPMASRCWPRSAPSTRRPFGWPRSAGVTGNRCGRSSARSLWARSTTG